MRDLIIGIITISICSVGYYYSWKFQRNENFRIAVLILLFCGLALRIYTSTDFYLHAWDERYHAVVAKNLIRHPLKPTLYDNPVLPYNYTNWGSNHIWLHKQPLPLWTMAMSMWMFGVNEIALRLPSIILTTFAIWLTFSIASYFFNKKIGYLAAFFYSINGLIIELTAGRVATDHIDIFFLFFVELAIFLSIIFARTKKIQYNILAGVSIGAAILSKWLPALIVLPIWLLIVSSNEKFKLKEVILHLVVLISTCALIFLPWQLYIYKEYPLEASWEASHRLRHLVEVLDGRKEPFYYYLNMIRINYGELIYLPVFWFTWRSIKNLHDSERLAILIWFIIPTLFFSFVKTKMQAYILFTCPALFIMTAEFWYMFATYKQNRKSKWLFNLILILLIALPIRYTIERVKPFDRLDRYPQWVAELKKLNEQDIRNGILLNYKRPIEAMFYTNLTAYTQIPNQNVIISWISEGYTVLINDDGNIPATIRTIEGIKLQNLNARNIAEN